MWINLFLLSLLRLARMWHAPQRQTDVRITFEWAKKGNYWHVHKCTSMDVSVSERNIEWVGVLRRCDAIRTHENFNESRNTSCCLFTALKCVCVFVPPFRFPGYLHRSWYVFHNNTTHIEVNCDFFWWAGCVAEYCWLCVWRDTSSGSAADECGSWLDALDS